MEIDKRDLFNTMRHAYLCGANAGQPDDTENKTTGENVWETVREETIKELIEDLEEGRAVCYNDYPCSCPQDTEYDRDL